MQKNKIFIVFLTSTCNAKKNENDMECNC